MNINGRNTGSMWNVCRIALLLYFFMSFIAIKAESQHVMHDLRSVRIADLMVEFEDFEHFDIDQEWHETMPVDTLHLQRIRFFQLQQALQMREQIRTPEPALKKSTGILQQHGFGNHMTTSIYAGNMIIMMNQIGMFNSIFAEIYGHDLEIDLLQEGEWNDSRFFIDAEGLTLTAEQTGDWNEIEINQSSCDASINLEQSGFFLDIWSVFTGEELEISAVQMGYMNDIVTEQTGSGHSTRIHQEGRYNRNLIIQADY